VLIFQFHLYTRRERAYLTYPSRLSL